MIAARMKMAAKLKTRCSHNDPNILWELE